MNESQITICGHGSNTPSLKNLNEYCDLRQNQKASNGKTKGLVEVIRFLETEEQRQIFHDTYKTILGRNDYNQNLRQYCYTPYKGKYYSDCSSSGCKTYEKCGIKGVGSYNTAAMHNKGQKLNVEIINGHIAEESLPKLKVGDALMFRGNDPSRPLQIGHVEYIYELPNEKHGWVESNGKWYYYDDDDFGIKLKKKWLRYNHHWYRLGNDGAMLTGWHQIEDENGTLAWCYFDETEENLGAEWHERSDRVGYLELWTTID